MTDLAHAHLGKPKFKEGDVVEYTTSLDLDFEYTTSLDLDLAMYQAVKTLLEQMEAGWRKTITTLKERNRLGLASPVYIDENEKTYEDNELQKINMALQIVDYYPEDKFLIFVHTKRTGELMKQTLQRAKINCEYHNADLDKAKRNKLEKQFKEDPSLRVIVATSTLAWDLNLPARRVIVLGVHRGMSDDIAGRHKERATCTCSIETLMASGCQCGHLENGKS